MKKTKFPIFTTLLVVVFLLFWVGLISGNILWTSNTPPLQVIPDMDVQTRVQPQRLNTFFATRSATRAPLEHTVPRYGEIYRPTTPEEAEEEYRNTLPNNAITLARGKNRYGVYCTPCHGASGEGEGSVAARSVTLKPPSLIAEAALARSHSDARLFHIISAGQNIMPGYRDKLKEVDRWAVVNYIREMQREAGGYFWTAEAAAAQASALEESEEDGESEGGTE